MSLKRRNIFILKDSFQNDISSKWPRSHRKLWTLQNYLLSRIAFLLKMLWLLQAMKILVQIVARNVLNLYVQGRQFYFHLMFRLQNVKKKILFLIEHNKDTQWWNNLLDSNKYLRTFCPLVFSTSNIQLYHHHCEITVSLLLSPASENRMFSIFFCPATPIIWKLLTNLKALKELRYPVWQIIFPLTSHNLDCSLCPL